jgi:hypothetical protein
MTPSKTRKLALLWPRDAPKWQAVRPQVNRLKIVSEALAALGIEAEPAVYADDAADQVREQLLRCERVVFKSIAPDFTPNGPRTPSKFVTDMC